ncbi:hypothetical protein HMPREF9057_01825 [Actinomyces sp. oral taxon 171 str. F0337]|nr:hypothetical protein HMPREF9057_01825 [Actinomyces sp. oral taxon 171 str. F0337]
MNHRLRRGRRCHQSWDLPFLEITVYDPRNILPRKGVWGPPHDEVVLVLLP